MLLGPHRVRTVADRSVLRARSGTPAGSRRADYGTYRKDAFGADGPVPRRFQPEELAGPCRRVHARGLRDRPLRRPDDGPRLLPEPFAAEGRPPAGRANQV